MTNTIFGSGGRRKYLNSSEINLFMKASTLFSDDIQAFCLMIAYTGCRISEALSLCERSIDFTSRCVIILSLKKRGKIVYRSVPLPTDYLRFLRTWMNSRNDSMDHLWPWSRMTGYRRIREVMQAANIDGYHASPKGLRHGFGVRAIQASVPLNLVQRWLGHVNIKTTAIYTDAIGPEERQLASKMWKRPSSQLRPSLHSAGITN